MAGYHTLLSRFHISAAMVLATVACLAVPDQALADITAATSCYNTNCASLTIGTPAYWKCVADCCNNNDPNDPSCCGTLCTLSAGLDPNCITQCGMLMLFDKSCPTAPNGCAANNGNKKGCGNFTCMESPTQSCLCIYDAPNCNCPR
jgi:hypothetical protein